MCVKLKIGRKIFNIDENDLILDNGSVYQIVTQEIRSNDWSLYSPQISKTLFNKLKKENLIYTNQELIDIASKTYAVKGCTLYKFDIKAMINSKLENVIKESTL